MVDSSKLGYELAVLQTAHNWVKIGSRLGPRNSCEYLLKMGLNEKQVKTQIARKLHAKGAWHLVPWLENGWHPEEIKNE